MYLYINTFECVLQECDAAAGVYNKRSTHGTRVCDDRAVLIVSLAVTRPPPPGLGIAGPAGYKKPPVPVYNKNCAAPSLPPSFPPPQPERWLARQESARRRRRVGLFRGPPPPPLQLAIYGHLSGAHRLHAVQDSAQRHIMSEQEARDFTAPPCLII